MSMIYIHGVPDSRTSRDPSCTWIPSLASCSLDFTSTEIRGILYTYPLTREIWRTKNLQIRLQPLFLLFSRNSLVEITESSSTLENEFSILPKNSSFRRDFDIWKGKYFPAKEKQKQSESDEAKFVSSRRINRFKQLRVGCGWKWLCKRQIYARVAISSHLLSHVNNCKSAANRRQLFKLVRLSLIFVLCQATIYTSSVKFKRAFLKYNWQLISKESIECSKKNEMNIFRSIVFPQKCSSI